MDDKDGERTEEEVVAQGTEAEKGGHWGYNARGSFKEFAMLLEDGLIGVLTCPIVFRGPVWSLG